MKSIRYWIEPGVVPIALAIAFALFILAYRIIGLPSPAELSTILEEFYIRHGIITLLLAAFMEGIFMISLYFPGSFAILLAVYVSSRTPLSLASIGAISWLGFIFSGGVNYFMGKYGYYRVLLFLGKKDTIRNMRQWLRRHGLWALFLSSIHPNYLSVSLVCSGIAGESFLLTMLVAGISLMFWITVWIFTVTPLLDRVDIADPNQSLYIVLAFIVWGLLLIIKDRIWPKIVKIISSI